MTNKDSAPLDHDSFTAKEVYRLHEAVIRLDRLAKKLVLEPRGVSYPEFLVMMAVRELGRPTQDEAARFLDLSKSLVSQRVSALLSRSLVLQTTNPENRREVHLKLTQDGESRVTEIYGALTEASDRVFAALGEGRAEFGRSLAQVVLMLRAIEEDGLL